MDITDEVMRERLSRMRSYTLALLRPGPAYEPPAERSAAQKAIVWEHGRRNMQLQTAGVMPLVGPVTGGPGVVGICVFSVGEDEARALVSADPAIQAGVLTFDLVGWFGTPGNALPA